jgi:hypothetical protein
MICFFNVRLWRPSRSMQHLDCVDRGKALRSRIAPEQMIFTRFLLDKQSSTVRPGQ